MRMLIWLLAIMRIKKMSNLELILVLLLRMILLLKTICC